MSERKLGRSSAPITTYYQFKPSSKPNPKVKVLTKGQEFVGTYKHRFINEENDITNNLIELTSGEAVTIKGCTGLNKDLDEAGKNTKVRIVFKGEGKKQPGKHAPWLFDVFLIENDSPAVEAPADLDTDEADEVSDDQPF